MSTYGSSFIKHLQFRSNWAFVVSGTKNQRIVHAESFQNPSKGGEWASPVKIRTVVNLLPENAVKCNWEDTIVNRRRREFCDKYEGYGDVCRCKFVCFRSCSFDLGWIARWERERGITCGNIKATSLDAVALSGSGSIDWGSFGSYFWKTLLSYCLTSPAGGEWLPMESNSKLDKLWEKRGREEVGRGDHDGRVS